MKKQYTSNRCKLTSRGFTLIELIIALVISLVVMSGIYAYCNSQHKSHSVQTLVNEMNQNIRIVMNRIVSEVRMAGFKTGSSTSDLLKDTAIWTTGLVPTSPYAPTMDGYLVITDGVSNPEDDMITFIYGETAPSVIAIDPVMNPTIIPLDAAAGTIAVYVSLTSAQTPEKFKRGDILYIGSGHVNPSENLEHGKVIGTKYNRVWFDTEPSTSTYEGVKFGHATGTEVGLMRVVTYAVFNDDNDPSFSEHRKGHPALKRKCNTDGMKLIAEDIESMEIEEIGDDIKITLISRTSKEDNDYIHPESGDHFRRRVLTSMVRIRNR